MMPQNISRIRYRVVMSLRGKVTTETISHLRYHIDHDTIIMLGKYMQSLSPDCHFSSLQSILRKAF